MTPAQGLGRIKRQVREEDIRLKHKIIFLDHASILSGGERSLLDILTSFPWEGCYAPILVCPSKGPLTAAVSQLGVRVEILPVSGAVLDRKRKDIGFLSCGSDLLKILSSLVRLRRLLSREKACLLVTNSQKAHLIGALASFLTPTPLLWYFRDILPSRLMRLVLLFGCLPKEIIAISQAVGDQFTVAGRRWRKVVVIPNGIDLDGIRRRAGAKEELLRELGLPMRSRLVGSVGQIARWKGQQYLVEAAKKVGEKFREARFLIVGDVLFGEADYKKELIELVRDLGLTDKVIFTGYRNDSPSLMNALDVLVHTPAHPEPFGRVLVEAMALGKPIVASSSGAVPEIVLDGETGILVPPRDSEALAGALEHLLQRPGTAREMGRRGRERAKEFFSIDRLISDVEAAFERALSTA